MFFKNVIQLCLLFLFEMLEFPSVILPEVKVAIFISVYVVIYNILTYLLNNITCASLLILITSNLVLWSFFKIFLSPPLLDF